MQVSRAEDEASHTQPARAEGELWRVAKGQIFTDKEISSIINIKVTTHLTT